MARKEEAIIALERDYMTSDSNAPHEVKQAYSSGFLTGVLWADEHPKSKYNLSNADYVKSVLESIISNAERLTTANVAHNGNSIRLLAKAAMNSIVENKE